MEQPKVEMKTMVSCLNKLQAEGFNENFTIDKAGLHVPEKDEVYTPEDVRITDFYRFEGDSDPADNSILYGIETKDGKKGILIDAYGSYSDENISRFIRHVEEMGKKNTNVQKPEGGAH